MKRWDIINKLIDKHNYKTYVEIGLHNGVCFKKVNIYNKISVDPASKYNADFVMTSDDFFNGISEGVKYDIFLVDGLHHSEQVYKDIQNALNHLSDGGTIVCHDMNPTTDDMQKVPRISNEWTGDCWKAFVQLRIERDDLDMFVVNTDYGCGVIRNGNQNKLVTNCDLNYDNFDKNRIEWLNLVSETEFISKA